MDCLASVCHTLRPGLWSCENTTDGYCYQFIEALRLFSVQKRTEVFWTKLANCSTQFAASLLFSTRRIFYDRKSISYAFCISILPFRAFSSTPLKADCFSASVPEIIKICHTNGTYTHTQYTIKYFTFISCVLAYWTVPPSKSFAQFCVTHWLRTPEKNVEWGYRLWSSLYSFVMFVKYCLSNENFYPGQKSLYEERIEKKQKPAASPQSVSHQHSVFKKTKLVKFMLDSIFVMLRAPKTLQR